jgi:hypothetical protein
VTKFGGENGPLPWPQQHLLVSRQAHGLVGGEQGTADALGGAAVAGGAMPLGVVRDGVGAAVGLKTDGAVAECLGEPLGGVEVGRGSDLEQAGIGEEGAGALAIGGAQLGQVLPDGPELQAEARHQSRSLQHRL